MEKFRQQNLNPAMQDKVPLFMLRGGLNHITMNLLEGFLMYLLVKSLKRKKVEQLDDDSKGMLVTCGKGS